MTRTSHDRERDNVGVNYRAIRNIENYYRDRGEPIPIVILSGNMTTGYRFTSNLAFDCKNLCRIDYSGGSAVRSALRGKDK